MTEKLNTNKWKQISIDSWKTIRLPWFVNTQIIKSFPLHSSRKCMQRKVKKYHIGDTFLSILFWYRYIVPRYSEKIQKMYLDAYLADTRYDTPILCLTLRLVDPIIFCFNGITLPMYLVSFIFSICRQKIFIL